MTVVLFKECFHVLTFVIALMPDLDKGQYGRVPIVLECPFADVHILNIYTSNDAYMMAFKFDFG